MHKVYGCAPVTRGLTNLIAVPSVLVQFLPWFFKNNLERKPDTFFSLGNHSHFWKLFSLSLNSHCSIFFLSKTGFHFTYFSNSMCPLIVTGVRLNLELLAQVWVMHNWSVKGPIILKTPYHRFLL